jgi:hypothetical protein
VVTPARSRWLAFALALGVFVTGLAAGIAVDRLFLLDRDGGDQRRGRPRSAEELLERYRERLDLDDRQAALVGDILRRRFSEAGAVMTEFDPQMEAIRKLGNGEVRALLRPDQRPRFDEIVKEQEERRAAMRKRFTPEPQPD